MIFFFAQWQPLLRRDHQFLVARRTLVTPSQAIKEYSIAPLTPSLSSNSQSSFSYSSSCHQSTHSASLDQKDSSFLRQRRPGRWLGANARWQAAHQRNSLSGNSD